MASRSGSYNTEQLLHAVAAKLTQLTIHDKSHRHPQDDQDVNLQRTLCYLVTRLTADQLDTLLRRRNHDGDTVLMEAIIYQWHIFTRFLVSLSDRTHMDERNRSGQTALHIAVLSSYPDIIDSLVSRGADLCAIDHTGNTPLHLACSRADYAAINALVNSVAPNNCPDYDLLCQQLPQIYNFAGQTCLHVAVLTGSLRIVQTFITDSFHLRNQCT